MTAGEFRAWMDGFLTSRDKLTKGDVELIRKKAATVTPDYVTKYVPYYAYPVYPYYTNPWTYTSQASSPTYTGPLDFSSTVSVKPYCWERLFEYRVPALPSN